MKPAWKNLHDKVINKERGFHGDQSKVCKFGM